MEKSMRYLVALLLIVLLIFAAYKYNEGSLPEGGKSKSSGIVHYGAETLSTLDANGFVTLDSTFVRKALTVHGTLSAEKAQINNMHVSGKASLSDCVVNGQTQVSGFLSAKACSFRGPLELTMHSVTFEDCNLDTIVIKKPFWSLLTQKVELTGKSICKGTITFESGSGKVIVSGKSQMVGTVHGGEVVKE